MALHVSAGDVGRAGNWDILKTDTHGVEAIFFSSFLLGPA